MRKLSKQSVFLTMLLLCMSGVLLSQVPNKSLSGKVISELGEPISSVTITLKSPSNVEQIVSDRDGMFTFSAISPNVKYTLIFEHLSYETDSITNVSISNYSENNPLVIRLRVAEQKSTLEDVVVIGYGNQKKVNLTGAVSSISAKALESRPVATLGQALQGLIPGLNLSTAGLGGELNQNMAVNIRGGGTIGAGSNSAPLVLIDGMEGDLNALNIQDIENISVLKDAGAAAIYGSRAPFGVILITTKKGKSGKANINYNNSFRWTKPIGLPKMLDSYRFALYWNENAQNDGEGAKFSQEIIDKIIAYQNGTLDSGTTRAGTSINWPMYTGSNANTDWFKEQYKPAAFAQDHNLSISGGSDKNQYYVSANYLNQGGLSRHGRDRFKRYTVTGKLNSQLTQHVKFDYTSRFVREDYQRAAHMFDLYYHNIARRWPTVPVKTPDGLYYSDASEIAQLEQGGTDNDQEDWLYQQGRLTVTPLKGWNIVADANYRISNVNSHREILPAYSGDVQGRPIAQPVGWNSAGYTYVYEYARKENYLSTNIFSDYAFKIKNRSNFKALLGFNSELNKYRTIGASRTGLITPLVPTINTATSQSMATEGQYQHWATAGFFGRLNYNFDERYLLEVNARYDGSSRFLRDQRWNLFPSVSVGWNIAKENFWNEAWNVQNFKLRASYGELGNQNTGNWYPFYLTQPFGVANGAWLLNNERPNSASAPGIISTLLTWERVRSMNLGVDVSALRDRLTIIADYFKRKTVDMVGPAPELPVILGTSVPSINNTDMESYGFELEMSWRDRIGEFGYSVRAVLADDQQKVTNYPNPTGNIGTWYNGRKSGEIWGFTTVGIAKTQAEMDAHLATANQNAMGSNWQSGDIMYKDINGDGKVDRGSSVLSNTGDLSVIGNSTPRYRYSLDLGADWKGIDFRLYLQGVGKRDWMPNGPYFWGASGGMWQSAGFETHLDYFRDENSVMVNAGKADVNLDSYFPRPYFNTTKNQQTQTRYLQSASYLRVKNIQIGYTLPSAIMQRMKLSKVRIFMSGENMFTFTKLIKTFDPETVGLAGWSDGKTYPLAKVISLGLSVSF